MKTIELSQGLVAMVDDEDFEELDPYTWCAFKKGNTFYAVRHPKGANRTLIYMHRVICNTPKGLQTDHIDGDGLNNCKSNLRVVTSRQNNQNKHMKKSSIYPGVSWFKNEGKWYSKIKINGKTKHLGVFDVEADAFEAYLKALATINEMCVNDIVKEESKWCM